MSGSPYRFLPLGKAFGEASRSVLVQFPFAPKAAEGRLLGGEEGVRWFTLSERAAVLSI